MLIETSQLDEVQLICDSEECDGRETDHDADTIAYWETPDSGTVVWRRTCHDCSLNTTIRQRVGPAGNPSHDCEYYTDDSGNCSYCYC